MSVAPELDFTIPEKLRERIPSNLIFYPVFPRYYPLNKMTEAEQEQLIEDHFLFDKPVSPLLTSAGMARDWPDARGIWHNDNKNFLVWINEEDHTRVISMEKGGDMAAVFQRFSTGLSKVEKAYLFFFYLKTRISYTSGFFINFAEEFFYSLVFQ